MDVSLKHWFLHRFWSKKCTSHFCRETTNENNQFSKWETWIFNAILNQDKALKGIVGNQNWNYVMSAVTLINIESIERFKLLCRFVNLKEMKNKFTKGFKKRKIMKRFKSSASKMKNPRFFSTNIQI